MNKLNSGNKLEICLSLYPYTHFHLLNMIKYWSALKMSHIWVYEDVCSGNLQDQYFSLYFRDLFLIVCLLIQEDVYICLEGFTDTLRSAYYVKILYGYIAYFSYEE